jgi:hypothetical protein
MNFLSWLRKSDNEEEESSWKTSQRSSSEPTREKEVVCVDCQKETQKDLPSKSVNNDKGGSSNPASSVCADLYENVAKCMNQNQGQVSACRDEWKSFQSCHDLKSSTGSNNHP